MVFPLMAVGALAMAGSSLLGSLFGGKKKTVLPPAIKAEIEKLQYIPFGPERDALEARIKNTYNLSNEEFNAALTGMEGVLTGAEAANQATAGNIQGISNQLLTNAGNNAYQQFYGNPAQREQDMLAKLQAGNAAAFDPYGTQGAESQMRQGLLSADAARRGTVNSGIARRQMEQEHARMAAARAEADAKAIQTARQQGVSEGQIYNQAANLGLQNLNSAIGAQGQIAGLTQQNVGNRMNAAKLYGDTQYQQGSLLGAAQSEARNAQQAVQNYNTETQNKVNQDYASAQNQRNFGQANIDMNYTKPNIFNSISGAIGAGMSVLGAGGGMGGGSGCSGASCATPGSNSYSSTYSNPNPTGNYYSNYQGGF